MGGEKWMRVQSAHTCPKHIMCRGALLIFAENSIKLHGGKNHCTLCNDSPLTSESIDLLQRRFNILLSVVAAVALQNCI